MQVRPWRVRLAGTFPTVVAAAGFSTLVAIGLRLTWSPGLRSYVEYVPIGGAFAAFVWERVFPAISRDRRHNLCDVMAVALALMRVLVPPWPFVSGHTLFAAYACLTARRWALRGISMLVLGQVIYVKIFVSTGWRSMLGGLVVAAALATIRARRRSGR